MQKLTLYLLKQIALLSLLTFCAICVAEEAFKIITLQHRFANELLPILSPMVGDGGTATGINNQLILRTTPERMREIEQAISQLDTARVNRKISIRTNDDRQSQLTKLDANGNIKIGNVSISNNRRVPPNSANVQIQQDISNSRQNTNQFMNVLEGERAFIHVGQAVPFTQDWVTITNRYVQLSKTTDWREISTGFAVRIRSIGSQVELEITPRIAKLNAQGYIDFEELSTTIHAQLGEWVDLGATMRSKDEVSSKILATQSSVSHQNTSLMVKVD